VGLGIHGEPGIAEADLPRAADLARILVDKVLTEAPTDGTRRAGVILNGLGATKYEELFVVWRTAAQLLRDAGYTLVDPEVGELVTSLDMAGCSLTVAFLDDELESLWRAPADTPAYRKGAVTKDPDGARRSIDTETTTSATTTAASAASQRAGAAASAVLTAMADALDEAADELGRIDAVAGDGDHGRGMTKGSAAARAAAAAAAEDGAGVASVQPRRGCLGGQGGRNFRGACGERPCPRSERHSATTPNRSPAPRSRPPSEPAST
jgi:dihydroxyacetone kinase